MAAWAIVSQQPNSSAAIVRRSDGGGPSNFATSADDFVINRVLFRTPSYSYYGESPFSMGSVPFRTTQTIEILQLRGE
jgi:hypothetical protein